MVVLREDSLRYVIRYIRFYYNLTIEVEID